MEYLQRLLTLYSQMGKSSQVGKSSHQYILNTWVLRRRDVHLQLSPAQLWTIQHCLQSFYPFYFSFLLFWQLMFGEIRLVANTFLLFPFSFLLFTFPFCCSGNWCLARSDRGLIPGIAQADPCHSATFLPSEYSTQNTSIMTNSSIQNQAYLSECHQRLPNV